MEFCLSIVKLSNVYETIFENNCAKLNKINKFDQNTN